MLVVSLGYRGPGRINRELIISADLISVLPGKILLVDAAALCEIQLKFRRNSRCRPGEKEKGSARRFIVINNFLLRRRNDIMRWSREWKEASGGFVAPS